ncbi:MAG: hypothetical protein H6719_19320 [Sandaracinaceae bacterium]|nr:hypothetical protein [Sandaracinaceae bacterium]
MPTTSIVVLGTSTPRGEQWLRDQFPSAARVTRGLVLFCEGSELDGVVFAEELRLEAQREGIRLSLGVAERPVGLPVRHAVANATRACDRAHALGGDMTVACSAMLRAA